MKTTPMKRNVGIINKRTFFAGWLALVGFAGAVVSDARADYAEEVLKDGPVAWWRFQDSASGDRAVAKDETKQHPGVYHGNTTVAASVPGIGGQTAKFDGRNAFVEVANHADFALDTISVECWFCSTQPWPVAGWPGSATLVTKGTKGAGSSDWTIIGGDNGSVSVRVGPKSGTDAVYASPPNLNDGQWHHVIWTRTSEGQNRLYVDGVLVATGKDSGGAITNDRPIQIGGDPFLNGKYLDGQMAEVTIYKTALTAERVAAHVKAAGIEPNRFSVAQAAPTPARKPKRETYIGPIPGPNVKDSSGWRDVASTEKDADGFVPLFDGKTFNGWEGNAKVWRIEDGALVGGSRSESIRASEYLCTVNGFTNFELRLAFKALATRGEEVNGGIQFRSSRTGSTQVKGYQADLGVFKFDPGKFWGCLFDNSRRNKILAGDPFANEKLVHKGDWNNYVIRAEGRHIQLWFNGTPTVDYTEPDDRISQTGIFGLQTHSGPPQELWYKNIRIKTLPD